jgi:3-hydroxybutyryl-CoA dehydratase
MSVNVEKSSDKGTVFIEFLKVDTERSSYKKITEKGINIFAKLSDDYNPLHLDSEYAKKNVLGKKISHGMLTASLISAVTGKKLPCPGSIYLSQSLKFIKPVLPKQTIKKTFKAAEIDYCTNKLRLKCECFINEILVLSGESTVLNPIDKSI